MNDTKERPIVLTAQEVNAVLAGYKTQHRAPVLTSEQLKEGFEWDFGADGDSAIFIKKIDDERQEVLLKPCPFGAESDRLWVQEPTLAIEDVGWIGPVFVASDNGRHAIDWGYGPSDDPAHIPACELTYNKSCDLSYEDSRLLLEITDIRIERVQDISEADAIATGLKPDYCDHKYQTCEDIGCIGKWAGALWLHLRHDKKLPVHHTAWVWVIEFKVVEPSEVISE